MAQMTVVDCFAFCVLVASAAWIAAMWIWKGAASESESKRLSDGPKPKGY